MSTESIFMAGAKLASQLIGLPGPVEVDYQNDHIERRNVQHDYSDYDYRTLVEECETRQIQIRVEPKELEEMMTELGDKIEEQQAINSILQSRLLENDAEFAENGKLGKLFIGSTDKKITFKDIKTFVKILSEGDYFEHYPIVDVHLYKDKKKVRLIWST